MHQKCAPPARAVWRRPGQRTIATAQLKLVTIDRGVCALEMRVRPEISQRASLQGWGLLVDRATGHFQAITRWSSKTAALGAVRDDFNERAGALDGLLDGTASQALFEDVR